MPQLNSFILTMWMLDEVLHLIKNKLLKVYNLMILHSSASSHLSVLTTRGRCDSLLCSSRYSLHNWVQMRPREETVQILISVCCYYWKLYQPCSMTRNPMQKLCQQHRGKKSKTLSLLNQIIFDLCLDFSCVISSSITQLWKEAKVVWSVPSAAGEISDL